MYQLPQPKQYSKIPTDTSSIGGLNKAHRVIRINNSLESTFCQIASKIKFKENRAELQRNNRKANR